MKLAKDKESKRIRKIAIPLFALIFVGVFLSFSVSAVPVVLFHSTFDAYDADNYIEGWTVRQSSGTHQDSYASEGILILYPNEGIDRKISQDSIPYEFNVSVRFNLYKTYWADTNDVAYIWDMNQNNFNTGSSGYTLMTSHVQYIEANETFKFRITNGYSGHIDYYLDPSYAWGLDLHFYRFDGGSGNYHLLTYDVSLWRDYYTAPGDELTIPLGTNISSKYALDDSNFDYVYLRVGPYSAGSSSNPGDLWVKDIIMSWEDGTVLPPTTPDYDETSIVIQNLVHEIVFFIPILVLTSLFGRIGFMGGIGIMAVVWMFSSSDFIASGLMMFIALGIFVYKGGME